MFARLNKKFFAIIAMVMCVCLAFTACGSGDENSEPTHKHTYDTSTWITDADQHWHAASCEHSDVKADVGAHEDEDLDEICDVCDYNMHTHTYTTEWTTDAFYHWYAATCGCEDVKSEYAEHTDTAEVDGKCDTCGADIHTCEFDTTKWATDADSHWYATTCGHDKKQSEAAHTKNALGICTVCSYGADVEGAIDLGVANKDKVMNGTVTVNSRGETYEYEYDFRNGYLYVKDAYGTETYYVLVGNEIFAVATSYGSAYIDGGATADNIDGFYFYGGYTAYDFGFYGVEDLVEGLYQMGSVDNLNKDFAESYADGVFTFSFGHYVDGWGLFVYTVSFTVNEDTLVIDTVSLDVKNYGTGDIVELVPATEEEPAVWAPKDDASYTAYTLTIAQSTVESENYNTENPYSPEKVFLSDFGISLEKEGEAETSLELKAGTSGDIYIIGIAPDTAVIELNTITATVDSEDLTIYCYEGYMYYSVDGAAGSVYNLTVTIGGVEKTFTITVVENPATTITAGTVGDSFGNFFVDTTDNVTITEGDNTQIGAYLDVTTATVTVTVNGEAVDAADIERLAFWDDVVGGYNYIYAINTSKLTAGTYTVTFTCAEDETLTTSVTVTVEEREFNPDELIYNVTTTDTYCFIDYYEFVAEAAGTYTFKLPAGVGIYSAAARAAFAAPEVDFYDSDGKSTVTVELAAGEKYGFYVGAISKGDWIITYTFEAGAPAVMKDANGLGGEYTFTFVMQFSLTFAPTAEGATSGTVTVVDPVSSKYSGTYAYTIVNGEYVFESENITITCDEQNWYFKNPGIIAPQAFATVA